MGNFVIYKIDTGEIDQFGLSPDGEEPDSFSEGFSLAFGFGEPHSHYVAGGEIHPYTDEELVAKNNLPAGWIWKMPERIPADGRTLDQAKGQAWERIKTRRAEEEAKPFECDGSVYDADRDRISGAVQMAAIAQSTGASYSIDWTLADNTVKTLDAAGMIAVGVALGNRVNSIFDTARTLREQIESCTTNAEADAITWP